MPDFDPQDLAKLASELHAAPTVAGTAEQVVSYAMTQLDADHAGITLRRRDRLETIAPSSPVVEQADRLQYELQEGPCVESAWESESFRSPSLAEDVRWPHWGPRVSAIGIASALAVALPSVDNEPIGALNLYWSRRRTFTSDDVAFAHIFGRHAAVALDNTMNEVNLRVALDTRKRIGQAQGILMERFDLDEDQAFQVLRRYSQDHNLKLRHVAEQLVATRRLPRQPPSTP